MRFNRACRAVGTTAVRLYGALLPLCLSCCAVAGELKVPLDHTLKKEFRQAESVGQFESIPAQHIVFTNEVDWNSFWKKFSITPPKIDFTSTNALAVFAGQKPSSGYSVEIQSIVFQPKQKKLRIKVVEFEPPVSVGTLSVLTFPYDMVTFRVSGEWKNFEVTKQKRKGKP